MSDLEKPGLVFSLKRILLFRGFKTKHICTVLHIDFIAAILKKKKERMQMDRQFCPNFSCHKLLGGFPGAALTS